MTVITGVHHIALKCKGIEYFEKTVSFYRDILGVPAVRQWGKGTESESCLNPGIIEIFSDGNDIPGEGAIRHVAFAPKLRGKEIYGKLKKDIGQILRKLREQKDVQIIEAEACPDYICW